MKTNPTMGDIMFFDWLEKKHPDVKLHPLQKKVVELLQAYQRNQITRETLISNLEKIIKETSDEQFIAEIKRMIKQVKKAVKP